MDVPDDGMLFRLFAGPAKIVKPSSEPKVKTTPFKLFSGAIANIELSDDEEITTDQPIKRPEVYARRRQQRRKPRSSGPDEAVIVLEESDIDLDHCRGPQAGREDYSRDLDENGCGESVSYSFSTSASDTDSSDDSESSSATFTHSTADAVIQTRVRASILAERTPSQHLRQFADESLAQGFLRSAVNGDLLHSRYAVQLDRLVDTEGETSVSETSSSSEDESSDSDDELPVTHQGKAKLARKQLTGSGCDISMANDSHPVGTPSPEVPDTQPFDFLGLPREIRNQVYRYFVPSSVTAFTYHSAFYDPNAVLPPVFRINAQIRAEALSLLYAGKYVLRFEPCGPACDCRVDKHNSSVQRRKIVHIPSPLMDEKFAKIHEYAGLKSFTPAQKQALRSFSHIQVSWVLGKYEYPREGIWGPKPIAKLLAAELMEAVADGSREVELIFDWSWLSPNGTVVAPKLKKLARWAEDFRKKKFKVKVVGARARNMHGRWELRSKIRLSITAEQKRKLAKRRGT